MWEDFADYAMVSNPRSKVFVTCFQRTLFKTSFVTSANLFFRHHENGVLFFIMHHAWLAQCNTHSRITAKIIFYIGGTAVRPKQIIATLKSGSWNN